MSKSESSVSRIDYIYSLNKMNNEIKSLKNKLDDEKLDSDGKVKIKKKIVELENGIVDKKKKLGINDQAPILINDKKCFICGRSEDDFKNTIDSVCKEYDRQIKEKEDGIKLRYDLMKKNKEEESKIIFNQLKDLEGNPLLDIKVSTIYTDLEKFKSKIPHLNLLWEHRSREDEKLITILERLKAHYTSKTNDNPYPSSFNKIVSSNEHTTVMNSISGIKPSREDAALLKEIDALQIGIKQTHNNKANFVVESGLYLNEYNVNLYISVNICGICSTMFRDASGASFEKKLDFIEYRLYDLYNLKREYVDRLDKIQDYIIDEEARIEEEEYGIDD